MGPDRLRDEDAKCVTGKRIKSLFYVVKLVQTLCVRNILLLYVEAASLHSCWFVTLIYCIAITGFVLNTILFMQSNYSYLGT